MFLYIRSSEEQTVMNACNGSIRVIAPRSRAFGGEPQMDEHAQRRALRSTGRVGRARESSGVLPSAVPCHQGAGLVDMNAAAVTVNNETNVGNAEAA
jgi:hypothetical protein